MLPPRPDSIERERARSDERIAYRINEVAKLAGVSRSIVEKCIRQGRIRTRRVCGVVLLDPQDVHRVFGFAAGDDMVAPSRESLAEIEELLQ